MIKSKKRILIIAEMNRFNQARPRKNIKIFLAFIGWYTFLTLKFGNHSLPPSNGLGIAATRLNTNRCAFSSCKVFLLRPYSLING
jgi:hypothetical protein